MPSRKKGQPAALMDWQLDEIREAFNLFDTDASGQISYFELRSAMAALNYKPRKSELRAVVQEVDPDLTGSIGFEAFLAIMAKYWSTRDLRAEVDTIFGLIAGDRDTISSAQMGEVAKEIGENMTQDEIRDMADKLSSGMGSISKEAFARIMMPRQVGDDLDSVDD